MKNRISILINLIIFFSCSEDIEIKGKEYPFLTTEILKITTSGVLLQGKVLHEGSTGIKNIGFAFGENIEDLTSIELDKYTQTFQLHLNFNIPAGKEFFVRAFAENESYTTYGNTKSFISKGFDPDPARVSDFFPRSVTDKDEVIIIGKNFSISKESITILVGDKSAEVISTGRDTIKFEVPINLEAKKYPLTVQIFDQKISSGSLSVETPIISDFNPKEGFDSTLITITGKYFSRYEENINVFFGSAKSQVISVNDSVIQCFSPMSTVSGNVNVSVNVSTKSRTADNLFNVIGHEVTNIDPLSANVGDIITIKGNNFIQNNRASHVFFGEEKAEVIHLTNTLIKALVPNYSGQRDSIIIKNGMKKISHSFLKIPSWNKLQDFPGDARPDAVGMSINGYGYIGLGNGYYHDWWRYDSYAETWKRMVDFPGELPAKFISFVIDNKGYVLYKSRENGQNKKVWEYDPVQNIWMEKSPLIYDSSESSYTGNVIVANGKAYFWASSTYNKLFVFDPALNQWETKESPHSWESGYYQYIPFGYVINNRIFWFRGKVGYYSKDPILELFEYFPGTNKWVKLKTYNDLEIKQEMDFFSTSTHGYFGGGRDYLSTHPASSSKFWEFNPKDLSLKRKEDYLRKTVYSSSFVINDMIYFGLGYYHRDFWNFQP